MYGSKALPPPPASSLRTAGFLVSVAFFVSVLFMGVVMRSAGIGDDTPNHVPTLRLAAQTDSLTEELQQLQLELSADLEDVRISLAFDGSHPIVSGAFVPMKEAQEAPAVSVEGSATASAERYTYVLVDIDAPDPKAPTHAPFLHYILADLTVDAQSAEDPLQPQEQLMVVPYYPVTPPVGEHRYLSLLFRQQGAGFNGQDAALTAKRSNFDVAGFATAHKLQLVTTASFHSHPASQDE